MGRGHDAAAGFVLVAGSYLAFVPIHVFPADVLFIGTNAVGFAGAVLASAGLRAYATSGRAGTLALGTSLVAVPEALGFGISLMERDTLIQGIQGFLTLGVAVIALGAIRLARDPSGTPEHVETLRLGAFLGAVAFLLWTIFSVVGGSYVWLPGNLLAMAGYGIVSAALVPEPSPPSRSPS